MNVINKLKINETNGHNDIHANGHDDILMDTMI